jgi:hypothetical protein
MRFAAHSAGAVVVGLAAALIFVVGVEWMSSVLHPFPPGVDPSDIEVCRAHVARYPAGVLLLAALGWGLGTFVSSWLSTRIGPGRHPAPGIVIGAILLTLAGVNMAMLPYPVWFWILNLVGFPAGCYAGVMLGRGRQAA